jgi:2-amino-4-hydroxy-6-hydroxymethyldihydropteridine diphosphokinase
MHKAVISLGSNIQPQDNIAQTRMILAQKYKVIAESKFVPTKPIGPVQQPDFLNGVVYIETNHSLEPLKRDLQLIEQSLKRVRTKDKYAPRTIDLDIVVWDGQIIDQDFYTRTYLKAAVLEVLPQLKY